MHISGLIAFLLLSSAVFAQLNFPVLSQPAGFPPLVDPNVNMTLPPFIAPPDSIWATMPEMYQMPTAGLPPSWVNPYFAGVAQYQPPGQDPFTYTRYNLPTDTHVHVTHHRKDYSDVETDSSDDSDSSSKSAEWLTPGTTFDVSNATLSKQKDLGNGRYKFKSTVTAYQRVPQQNDQNSKTAATASCPECLQKKIDQFKQLQLATFTTALNNLHLSAAATNGANECLTRMLNEGKLNNTNYMTVVDFSKPANQQRLYLIDLHKGTSKAFSVGQGTNSGGAGQNRFLATKYSNAGGSHESSPGCYSTGELYNGEYSAGPSKNPPPKSMKLDGEDTCNSAARSREIVVHGFGFNNNSPADTWGCFGVGPTQDQADEVTSKMTGGGAWYAAPMPSAPGSQCKALD